MELTKQMSLLLCNDTCYSCHELSDMVVCSAEFHCLLCAQLGKVLRSFPSSLLQGFMMEAWCKRRTNDKYQLIFLHKVTHQVIGIKLQAVHNYWVLYGIVVGSDIRSIIDSADDCLAYESADGSADGSAILSFIREPSM